MAVLKETMRQSLIRPTSTPHEPAGTAGQKAPLVRREADWTPEITARFWDWVAAHPPNQQSYFSAQVGEGIIRLLRYYGRLHGRALDYGCGPGHLIGRFLDSNLKIYGADVSARSVAMVNEEFAGRRNWGGAKVINGGVAPFEDGSFDLISCIETVEHLGSAELDLMLADLRRLLSPTGTLFLTTPSEEDLNLAAAYCPFCNSEFHRWQHQRTYSAGSLSAILQQGGFKVLFCDSLSLQRFQAPLSRRRLLDYSPWHLLRYGRSYAFRLLDRVSLHFSIGPRIFAWLSSKPGPHLCAIAAKRDCD
ncbi:MAG: methyltransferase domain-containing protein [Candidatus Promineifilaceae bacterium]